MEWFHGFGFFQGAEGRKSLFEWRLPELATRAHPDEGPDRVLLMADFVHWTVFDDLQRRRHSGQDDPIMLLPHAGFEALAAKLSRLLEVPESRLLPPNAWIASLMDLRTPSRVYRERRTGRALGCGRPLLPPRCRLAPGIWRGPYPRWLTT